MLEEKFDNKGEIETVDLEELPYSRDTTSSSYLPEDTLEEDIKVSIESKLSKLSKGDLVKARYRGNFKWLFTSSKTVGKWYSGVIINERDCNRFDIMYDKDGEIE